MLTSQCEAVALCVPLGAIQHVLCEPTRASTDVSKVQQLVPTKDTALQRDINTSTHIITVHATHYIALGRPVLEWSPGNALDFALSTFLASLQQASPWDIMGHISFLAGIYPIQYVSISKVFIS